MPASSLESLRKEENSLTSQDMGRVSNVLLIASVGAYLVTAVLLFIDVKPALIWGALASTVATAAFGCLAAVLRNFRKTREARSTALPASEQSPLPTVAANTPGS